MINNIKMCETCRYDAWKRPEIHETPCIECDSNYSKWDNMIDEQLNYIPN